MPMNPPFSSSPCPLFHTGGKRRRPLPQRLALLTAIVSQLVGCFPVELDVTPDGGLIIARQEGWYQYQPATGDVTKLRAAGVDLPVFARISPDGSQLLTVAEVKNGTSQFDLRIGPIEGDESRLLLRARNPTYLRFSPDGSHIALTRMSTERIEPGQDEEVLELVLVDTTSGEVRRLAERVGPLIRWIGDGRELLAVRLIRRTEQRHILADLVRINAASGEATAVARVLMGECGHFDVGPDGLHAAVCAYAVGAQEAEFSVQDYPPQKLLLVELATGDMRPTDLAAMYALYSPNGKSLLVGSPPVGGSLSRGDKLSLTDADGANARVLADDAFVDSQIGGQAQVFPGWIDDERIFYFSERLVYGRTGRALSLMMIRSNGADRRCVQPEIDRAATSNP